MCTGIDESVTPTLFAYYILFHFSCFVETDAMRTGIDETATPTLYLCVYHLNYILCEQTCIR